MSLFAYNIFNLFKLLFDSSLIIIFFGWIYLFNVLKQRLYTISALSLTTKYDMVTSLKWRYVPIPRPSELKHGLNIYWIISIRFKWLKTPVREILYTRGAMKRKLLSLFDEKLNLGAKSLIFMNMQMS